MDTWVKSVNSEEFRAIINESKKTKTRQVRVDGEYIEIKKPFPSPQDWRDNWIYFLMIDRFNKSGHTDNYGMSRDGREWTNHEKFDKFLGGDIKGITEKLDYLKELGTGAIWISPPFRNCIYSNSYHGYGIQDFLSVDPRFGTEEDLVEMVEQAHARGIYVIFDIVLNHSGDVFQYAQTPPGKATEWSDHVYPILWRNEKGEGKYPEASDIPENHDSGVWPAELRNNNFFRRKGEIENSENGGDFYSLKEIVTSIPEVRETLINIYKYTIAKYDIDGFRIDTLKFIEPDFARTFGNAIREFALSIGKENFFTFGEINDGEEKIAQFIGRHTGDEEGIIGVDAALDFPLFFKLPYIIKGFASPGTLTDLFEERKNIQKYVISSHGEAGKYFVTFLDNHDGRGGDWRNPPRERIFCGDENYMNQVLMAIGSLFTLQGIPCLYYGTESGLYGADHNNDMVLRQALWMINNGFDTTSEFYTGIRKLSDIRKNEPAVRFGRQYFREVSGDGINFGISRFGDGILAYSRILNEREIIVIVNTSTTETRNVFINIDADTKKTEVIYSNHDITGTTVCEIINGRRTINVILNPMEIRICRNITVLDEEKPKLRTPLAEMVTL